MDSRRVAVTGLGIVSSLGCTLADVLEALRVGTSGLSASPALAEAGFQCHVYAPVRGWDPQVVPKRAVLSSSPGGQYGLAAAFSAVADAGLDLTALKNDRSAVIIGTALAGLDEAYRAEQLITTRKSPARAGGSGVLRMLNSSAAGNVAAYLGAQGRAYSISSSSATGADCIGHAYDLVRFGLQDVAICGAAEEAAWPFLMTVFEAEGMLPIGYNDRPQAACRPFDADRQGTVFSEGAGILMLEPLDRAVARGVRIYAEIVGYGAANDAADMLHPTGEGLRLAIADALRDSREAGITHIDYVNAHAAGTRPGDVSEIGVLRTFLDSDTRVSATKGQTGHAVGASGAIEVILSLLMLQHGFIAPTANLEHLDSACEGLRHVAGCTDIAIDTVLKISIGLGGSNACLVLRRYEASTT